MVHGKVLLENKTQDFNLYENTLIPNFNLYENTFGKYS